MPVPIVPTYESWGDTLEPAHPALGPTENHLVTLRPGRSILGEIRTLLAMSNIVPRAGTRLAKMLKCQEEVDAKLYAWAKQEIGTEPSFNGSDASLMLEMYRLLIVLRALQPTHYEQMPKLQRALEADALIPGGPNERAWGRDTFAEFYAAARFESAGMSVKFVEPDLQVEFNNRPWSIAVKRVRSWAKLEQRLRSARRQISHLEWPGLVVLDVTPLTPGYPHAVHHGTQRQLMERADRFITQCTDSLVVKARQTMKETRAKGLVAFYSFFSIDLESNQLVTWESVSTRALQANDALRSKQLTRIAGLLNTRPLAPSPAASDQERLVGSMTPISILDKRGRRKQRRLFGQC